MYQNPPLFPELASSFSSFAPLRFAMGQQFVHLTEGPYSSDLATTTIVMRIPYNSFDLF